MESRCPYSILRASVKARIILKHRSLVLPSLRMAHFISDLRDQVGDQVWGWFAFPQPDRQLTSWGAHLAEQENGPLFSQVNLVYLLTRQIPREKIARFFRARRIFSTFVLNSNFSFLFPLNCFPPDAPIFARHSATPFGKCGIHLIPPFQDNDQIFSSLPL